MGLDKERALSAVAGWPDSRRNRLARSRIDSALPNLGGRRPGSDPGGCRQPLPPAPDVAVAGGLVDQTASATAKDF